MPVTGHSEVAIPAAPSPADAVPERRRAVSIRDVARLAGVSYQTVSRVINDNPNVSPPTRERVRAAIEELGFRRSATALALASGRPRAVTVLLSDTTPYAHAAVLRGVEEAARAAGFSVGVAVPESAAEADVRAAVDRTATGGSALIVVACDHVGSRALELVPGGVPHVAVTAAPAAAGDDVARVWVDDRAAARDATRTLLALGHRTVHHVGGGRWSPRTAGWREALREAGIAPPAPCGPGRDVRDGYAAGLRLALDPGVTAVLCGNDDLALGVLRALHEAGRAVPHDVSVVGFDDAPYSAYLTPALSTVRIDYAGLGRAGFALLRGLVDPAGPAPALAPVAAPALIRRESAGPPAPHT